MEMVRYQKIDDVMEYTLLAWLGVGNFVTMNILEAPKNRNNVTNAIYKHNGREDLQWNQMSINNHGDQIRTWPFPGQ